MANLINSPYDVSDCIVIESYKERFLEHQKLLEDAINEVDYILSEQSNPISDINTINDLFLADIRLGMKCALLLVDHVSYLHNFYQSVSHFYDNGDVLALLNECSIDGDWMKYIYYVRDLKVPTGEANVHIYFYETSKPLNCQSLVCFRDKFVELIIKKLQIHQADCQLDECIRCTSLEELNKGKSPLLENFGTFNLDVEDTLDDRLNGFENISFDKKSDGDSEDEDCFQNEETADNLSVVVSSASVKNESKTASLNEEEHSWKDFKDIVLRKYKKLQQYYAENYPHLKEKEQPVVMLYTDTKENVQVVRCTSVSDARRAANLLQDISKDLFPVVLIANTNLELPSTVAKKRMVRETNPCKVGKEITPYLEGKLQTPAGRNPSTETPVRFYLDTGADDGSVGYNYHIIKHFILTVETINNSDEPAVLCNFEIPGITEEESGEEVKVFDVDEDPNWNALGLAVLKNYRIYLDIKNNKVFIGKHEAVNEHETEETFQVIFKKDIAPNPFLTRNPEELP